MAAGGGLFQTAIFSTILALLCLLVLGQVETRFNLKPITFAYDVITTSCDASESVIAALNQLLDQAGLTMQTVHLAKTDDSHCHLQFSVEAYLSQQEALAKKVKQLPLVMTMAKSTTAERD